MGRSVINKTHTRILFLLLVVTSLFCVGMGVLQYTQRQGMESLLKAQTSERMSTFDTLMKLKSTPLLSFTYDYSYWDDMLKFVQNGDRDWARINIDNVLPTFKLQAVWVYRPDLTAVYTTDTLPDADSAALLPLTREQLSQLVKASLFPHFFINTRHGLMEVSGAPVQPSADNVRATPPRGYLLAGRLWDVGFVKELSTLADSSLIFHSPAQNMPGQTAGPASPWATTFDKVLPGWDGRPVVSLNVRHESIELRKWYRSLNLQFALFVLYALSLLSLLFVFLSRWVGRPLRLISHALSVQNSAALDELHHTRTEFGPISRLIAEFFKQRGDLLSEISERRQLQSELVYLANHDTLTGLPNRALFRERLEQNIEQALRRGEHAAVLYVDVDRFKTVNDTLGHYAGDQLLKAVADRLIACVRHSDTAARLGGDEYVLLLSNVGNPDDAAAVATKILGALSQPFGLHTREIFVTGSIGISIYPDDGEDADTLIKHADSALFHAKEAGRNNYQFFDAEVREQTTRRLSLEQGLRRALERGEFLLHYQPRVDLKSGKTVAIEALLRWQHPQLGLIMPDAFIPLAEDTGIIVPIGEWVLHTACEQGVRWQRHGCPDLRLAINISPRQFKHREIVDDIKSVLQQTGFDPRHLELELTESLLMQNVDTAAATMLKLRRLGVGFSIDDFGVGYSSLNYLKRLPIDTIKIDRAFVLDLGASHSDVKLVDAIIKMAHTLRLRAVAEGVETAEQLHILRGHGCDEVQGFHIRCPAPAEEIGQELIGSRLPVAP